MGEALQALESAVQITGLRSLSPSLGAWHSPQELAWTAQRLEKANAQLESITGWEGKVLGLDGRVELSLGSPTTAGNMVAAVIADSSGRLQMSSNWSALGHEWFHAFEYTLSRVVMTHSTSAPLSENMQPLRLVEERGVRGAMKGLLAATDKDMPSWKSHRHAAAVVRGDYWVRPAEVLAFGFGAYVEQVHQADALGVLSEAARLRVSEPERGPSFWEVDALASPLRELFDASAHLGLSGQSLAIDPAHVSVSMAATVSEWRDSRRTEAQASVPPKTQERLRTIR